MCRKGCNKRVHACIVHAFTKWADIVHRRTLIVFLVSAIVFTGLSKQHFARLTLI